MPKRDRDGARFRYRKRDTADVRKRAEQSSGMYDSIIKDGVTMFTPKEGAYSIRILPPGWEPAKHYGYDIWVNYGIGPDKQTYLSLAKMKGGKDPIDEERRRAVAAGKDDLAKVYNPTRRVAVYVIDRADEDAGPKLWSMPVSVDRDLSQRMMDDDTGEVLYIDDPDEGYDVKFKRTGTGLNTKYEAIAIARKSTPLHRDEETASEWLEYITEKSIPDILNFYDYKHIEAVLHGEKSKDDEDDEDEDEDDGGPTRSKLRRTRVQADEDDDEDEYEDEDEEPKPRKKKPSRAHEDGDDDIPW